VLIKVLIAEVTLDDTTDMGVDFSAFNTRKSGKGDDFVQNLGNAAAQAANGGGAFTITEGNLTATLHALAVNNKLDVLSRPEILASDNQLASVTVGQEVPIVTGSEVSDLGTTTNNYVYQPIGIILNVQAHVNPDGLVTMLVGPQVSAISTQNVTISQGVTAPIFNNQAAQTQVAIKDGTTIVIGGMMQDQKSVTVNKIPILGDIPFIGGAFQREQTQKQKTELLIFLTPHVALQADRLQVITDEEKGGMKLTPHAVGEGVYKEHMRGMDRGGTDPRDGTPAATQQSPTVTPIIAPTPTPAPNH
jgi:general secretion pathway protein D